MKIKISMHFKSSWFLNVMDFETDIIVSVNHIPAGFTQVKLSTELL